jgi:hypothetical protein
MSRGNDRVPLQPAQIGTTIGDMPCPVTDVRARVLGRRSHKWVGGPVPPVPVEAIAEDLHGLAAEAITDLSVFIRPECGVSHEAMHWRLYNLGLVDDRP